MKQPIFIAHRGAYQKGRRENTVPAIERSAKSGRFAYIELDVRRTRSDDEGKQTSVVFHDETLDRLYEKYRIPKIKRHRLGQTINNLTIDIIRSEEIDIATLAEAMRAANGHPLNLELKSEEAMEPMLETINDLIKKYPEWKKEKIVISSKIWPLLYEVKRRDSELGIAMIYTFKHLPRAYGRTHHELGARWVSINKWLAYFLAPFAKIFDVPVVGAYTVNTNLEVFLLRILGVQIFFTDYVTLPKEIDS